MNIGFMGMGKKPEVRNKRLNPVRQGKEHEQQHSVNSVVKNNGNRQQMAFNHREKKEPLISLKGVKKAYNNAAGEFWALRGIDLEIYPGEYLLIIGKSGAGKTTLVNMITGVDRLSDGEVEVGKARVHHMGENDQALWRGLNLGVIYQSFQLMPTLSLMDNVLLPMDFCGLYRGRSSIERARELLKEVGLIDHIQKMPASISGGQQQRVAIARALANDPPIIVADEPTGRLDSVTAGVIFDIFEKLVQRGKTLVMVTHDRNIMKRVLEQPNGRVVEITDGCITNEWIGKGNETPI